ncbi:hypothetical protein MB46_06990 [Arthrobacter alpinus]|nr:hypothetical protein MB46_06990 [Arthrobacter alpinus]
MSGEVEAWCFRVLGHGTLTSLRAEAGGEMSHQFLYDSDEQGIVVVKVRSDSTFSELLPMLISHAPGR